MILLKRLSSLQARLLSLLLLGLSLVWIGAAVLTWVETSDELGELLDGHLAQSAALLVAQQSGGEAREGHHPGKSRRALSSANIGAPALHKYAPLVAFQVFHEGTLTLHSDNVPDAPLSASLRGFSTVTLADGQSWRVFGARGSEGDVQVFVGEQLQSRRSILWAVLQGVMMPLLYTLPLLAGLGWLVVSRGLAPLRSLSRALAQRQPQAIEPLIIADTPTEIAPVVQSLNALFGRIGQMLAAERRFTADAAHELRTPIAAIRAQAQVALGAGDDAAQRDQALRYTLEGCDRATHLVTQLLTLSRLEAAGASAPVAAVDLCGIAQRIAADLAPAALARQQVLELEAEAPCPVAADSALAGVLLRNLLDNALRYSPESARVRLRLRREGALVRLQIDDSGPGLAQPDLERLGERFFRALGNTQRGSGLGWSIVRRIAEVYRAQVEVGASELGGLSVTVLWPVAPDQRGAPILS